MARQRGDAWVGDVLIGAKRSRKTFATKALAEAYEQQAVLASRDLSIGKLWPTWAEKLWSNTKNERCAIGNATLIAQWMGIGLHVTAVDKAAVDRLVEYMQGEDYAIATINKKLACLSKLMNYARDEKVVTEVPKITFTKVNNGRITTLSFAQEDAMLAELPEPFKAFASFCLYTGCRFSEATRLRWEDVDLGEEPQVTFWATKTDGERSVPLVSEALTAIRKRREQGWMHPWTGIEYWTFSRAWSKARETVGLGPEFVPYVMRHTCATRLARGGMGELALMKWLGHTNVMMTKRYVQLNTKDLRVGASSLVRAPKLTVVS